MKTNINYLLALCFLLLCACKSGNASSQSKSETPQDTIKSFTLPTIPPMLTAPEQRADFLVSTIGTTLTLPTPIISITRKSPNKHGQTIATC